MAKTGQDDEREPLGTWAPTRVQAGGRRRAVVVAALAILALSTAVAVAVLAPPAPGGGPPAGGGSTSAAAAAPPSVAASSPGSGAPAESGTGAASPSIGPTSRASAPTPSPAPWVPGPPGRIAIIGPDGTLAVVDDETGASVPIPIPGVVSEPPAWSPDGTRIAAIAATPEVTRLYVVALPAAGTGGDPVPTAVYGSADQPPFYLYWAPDGTRVGFLASEADGISLRTAPADGSPPSDGQRHDGVLRRGAPLYFTWEDAGRLLLHVGAGDAAFAGEIDLDGAAAGATVRGTGDFRAAGASRDGGVVAYVRGGEASEIVVESRDGTSRGRLPVFGPAALEFDPTGTTLATIAADAPVANPVSFPFGPLRLLDAGSSRPRTLIDGSVVGFFWSPDGRTIAAMRLAPAGGSSSAARSGIALAAATAEPPTASPAPTVEVRLTFVDAVTGKVRSDRAVRLGDDFVGTVLPYFDQYALSHRVWSPDGQAIVLPLVDPDGRTRATVLDADGAEPRPIAEALNAFWAP